MGASKIETYNQPLMNLANYEDLKCLGGLLKNYDNLRLLAEKGDTVGSAIYIDLKVALEKGILTNLQKECIYRYFVYRSTLREIAEHLDKSIPTVADHIKGGVKRIQKAFISGALYHD